MDITHEQGSQSVVAQDLPKESTKPKKSVSFENQNGSNDVTTIVKNTKKDREGSRRQSLWLAAKNGWEDQVEIQLRTDELNPNEPDEDGRTALWWAAWGDRSSHSKVAALLLANDKVNINARDDEGRTPIHVAALKGHEEVTKLLLVEAALDVNCQDFNEATPRATPLHLAVGYEHKDVVKLLLLCPSIDVNIQDTGGHTPLHVAAIKGFEEITLLLLATKDINIDPPRNDNRTPLCLTSENGHTKVVLALLAAGVAARFGDPNSSPSWFSLHLAANNGHKEIVAALLTHAKDINCRDTSGQTPLHRAVYMGQKDVVKLLLDTKGVKMHAEDDNLVTPLFMAVDQGWQDIVDLFLEKSDTKPSSTPSRTETLVRYAVQTGESRVVEMVLNNDEDHTFDPTLEDKDHKTLLWLAAERKDDRMIKLLLQHDNNTLHLLIEHGELSLVKVLLQAGCDLKRFIDRRQSVLHVAISLGHLEIVKELLASGANADQQNQDRHTPLHQAVLQKKLDFIDLLLKNSASTTGILAKEWLEAYAKTPSDLVILGEERLGKKNVRFVKEHNASKEIAVASATKGKLRRIL